MEEYIELVGEYAIEYGTKLIGAILILIIGFWIIKKSIKSLNKVMDKKELDPSLKGFLMNLFNAILKTLVIISALGTLGLEMTSFIAILGAAGLAIGMALSGTLKNFAGGVVILLLKPFKVGHVIDAQGHIGTVKEIQVFHTIVKTFDNQTIIFPNGSLSDASLKNLSLEEKRRVDWIFGIGYGDDYDKAKDLILKFLNEDDRVLKDPEIFIALESLGDSSVNIVVRCWTKAADLWPVKFAINERVYKEFPKAELNIPFPQMDVHVHQEK